jgi:hypothetical protein
LLGGGMKGTPTQSPFPKCRGWEGGTDHRALTQNETVCTPLQIGDQVVEIVMPGSCFGNVQFIEPVPFLLLPPPCLRELPRSFLCILLL